MRARILPFLCYFDDNTRGYFKSFTFLQRESETENKGCSHLSLSKCPKLVFVLFYLHYQYLWISLRPSRIPELASKGNMERFQLSDWYNIRAHSGLKIWYSNESIAQYLLTMDQTAKLSTKFYVVLAGYKSVSNIHYEILVHVNWKLSRTKHVEETKRNFGARYAE